MNLLGRIAWILQKEGMETVNGTEIDSLVDRMHKTTRLVININKEDCTRIYSQLSLFRREANVICTQQMNQEILTQISSNLLNPFFSMIIPTLVQEDAIHQLATSASAQANGTDSEKGSSSSISCSGNSGGGGGGYGTTVLPASSPLLSSFGQTFPFSSAAGQINVPDHLASSGSMPDSVQVQCAKTKSIRQVIVNTLTHIYRQAVNLSQTHSSKSTTWGFTGRDTISGSYFIENYSHSEFVEFVDYYCKALMHSIRAMQQQIVSCKSTILIIEHLQTHTNLLQQRMSQTQTLLQNQNAIDLLEQRDSLIRRTIDTTQRQMDVLSAELERIEEMLHLESPGQPSMEEQLLIGAVKQSMDTIQPVIPTITTTFRASVSLNVYVERLSNLCILFVIRDGILIEQFRDIQTVEMIHMTSNVDFLSVSLETVKEVNMRLDT